MCNEIWYLSTIDMQSFDELWRLHNTWPWVKHRIDESSARVNVKDFAHIESPTLTIRLQNGKMYGNKHNLNVKIMKFSAALFSRLYTTAYGKVVHFPPLRTLLKNERKLKIWRFWTIFRQNGALFRQIGVFPAKMELFPQNGGIYRNLPCFFLLWLFTPPRRILTVHMYVSADKCWYFAWKFALVLPVSLRLVVLMYVVCLVWYRNMAITFEIVVRISWFFNTRKNYLLSICVPNLSHIWITQTSAQSFEFLQLSDPRASSICTCSFGKRFSP